MVEYGREARLCVEGEELDNARGNREQGEEQLLREGLVHSAIERGET